jgi:hypothetical protein
MKMKNIELLDSLEPSQIKAVFFDVDGTLVNKDHEISRQTRHAIRELIEQNITVSLATGRPYFGATNIMSELQINGPSLFYAGALIVEPHQGTPLFSKAIEPKVLQALIEEVSDKKLYCELYTQTDYYISQPHKFADIHTEYLDRSPKIVSFDELLFTDDILKVGFTVERGSPEETSLYETLARFSVLHFATAAGASHPALLWGSATHKDASREKAFDFLTSLMNISPKEAIAFGDGESDIPFLKLAGIGIAMGNSPESVKNAAIIVTKSIDLEGVAYAISRLLSQAA